MLTRESCSHSRPESGFTLVEVLVAFTIAVVLLVPILRSFSAGMASAARSDAVTEATLIAQSTVETVGAATPLADGESLDQEQGRYRVSASVHRYDYGAPPGGPALVVVPYEVVVTVTWQEAARTRSVALRTLRLGPLPASEQAP